MRKNNKHDVNSCLKRSNGCLKSFFDSNFISSSREIRRKYLILYKLAFYNTVCAIKDFMEMKFIKYEHYICLISIFIKRKTKKVGLHFQRNLPRGKLVYIFYMLFPVFVPPTIRFRTVQIKVLHFCLHFLSRHNFFVINVYMYELIDFIFYDHI